MRKWNKTSVIFISNWQEQVKEYQNLVHDAKNQLFSNLKHDMLKIAVFDIQELKYIHNFIDQSKISTENSKHMKTIVHSLLQ